MPETRERPAPRRRAEISAAMRRDPHARFTHVNTPAALARDRPHPRRYGGHSCRENRHQRENHGRRHERDGIVRPDSGETCTDDARHAQATSTACCQSPASPRVNSSTPDHEARNIDWLGTERHAHGELPHALADRVSEDAEQSRSAKGSDASPRLPRSIDGLLDQPLLVAVANHGLTLVPARTGSAARSCVLIRSASCAGSPAGRATIDPHEVHPGLPGPEISSVGSGRICGFGRPFKSMSRMTPTTGSHAFPSVTPPSFMRWPIALPSAKS